ncbi:IQ and AAA domain-containing protein 1-like [Ascaphus truei]|uniref:IQ and AAA domain-containing protein 1-like n=1 Tax=Ascaphus truei TaxID=8439 RepID=UPI003F593A35
METPVAPKTVAPRMISLEEAVRVIQVSERARQGRLRAKFMEEIRRDDERRKVRGTAVSEEEQERAIILIQKVWRGYYERCRTQEERLREMLFLGMAQSHEDSALPGSRIRALVMEEIRRVQRREHEAGYQQALRKAHDELHRTQGPDMKETLRDQIRQWLIECRDKTGRFPEFPDEESGGSRLICTEKTPEQLQAEMQQKENEKLNKKDTKKKGKGKKTETPKNEKKEKKKGKKEENSGLVLTPSKFVPDLTEEHNIFKTVWQHRDEGHNLRQRWDQELVREERRSNVTEEIRIVVDELMRQELRTLRMIIDRDPGKTSKGKSEKKKTKKGGKKRKVKDLTADSPSGIRFIQDLPKVLEDSSKTSYDTKIPSAITVVAERRKQLRRSTQRLRLAPLTEDSSKPFHE